MQNGTLYLLPNTLGGSDAGWTIPSRVRETVLRLTDLVVENEKSARRFLKELDPAVDQAALRITVLDKHDPESDPGKLLIPALEGRDMGLMSEAGLPAVADPGAAVVAEAHRRGIRVVPLAGPSSVLLALAASGLNGQRFCFHGYLPVEAGPRDAAIRKLERESRKEGQTQIFIETPYRNDKLLRALLAVCDAGTLLCVACAVTTDNESIRTQRIGDWKKAVPEIGKVPCVFLILSEQ